MNLSLKKKLNMNSKIKVVNGDITKFAVDAIVNAAKNSLLGGGGVDGAIHRAAGKDLLDACRLIGGCDTGFVKVTKGFKLNCKYIFHAVGPVWLNSSEQETLKNKQLLRSCYGKAMKLAIDLNCKSIAFPNISTGIYGFPKIPAANIAISEVSRWLSFAKTLKTVYFVCFEEDNFNIYKNILEEDLF